MYCQPCTRRRLNSSGNLKNTLTSENRRRGRADRQSSTDLCAERAAHRSTVGRKKKTRRISQWEEACACGGHGDGSSDGLPAALLIWVCYTWRTSRSTGGVGRSTERLGLMRLRLC